LPGPGDVLISDLYEGGNNDEMLRRAFTDYTDGQQNGFLAQLVGAYLPSLTTYLRALRRVCGARFGQVKALGRERKPGLADVARLCYSSPPAALVLKKASEIN
jgi:hypothetical protein